jgi:hypothetical protein
VVQTLLGHGADVAAKDAMVGAAWQGRSCRCVAVLFLLLDDSPLSFSIDSNMLLFLCI